eukprot:m.12064 g.12064  ORF g.12064 m.12064 type:complete len:99 (+) comp23784_c0_seq1:451-747(+)
MTTAAPGGQRSGRTVPEDKINLRLILATGSRAEFLFSPADSAQTVTKHVHENWPKGMENCVPLVAWKVHSPYRWFTFLRYTSGRVPYCFSETTDSLSD